MNSIAAQIFTDIALSSASISDATSGDWGYLAKNGVSFLTLQINIKKVRKIMCEIHHPGDILYFDFSPSVGNEIRGIRPAVVVSSDEYNKRSSYLTVMPITNHGNRFNSYIPLNGYKFVTGRINLFQMHCYSVDRVRSKTMERLRDADINKIRDYVEKIVVGA